MSRTSKLSTLEAMQILNLQKGEMKPDLIKKVRGQNLSAAYIQNVDS